jgi:transcription elongation factor Elf1
MQFHFQQEPLEIPLIKFICAICGHEVWTIFTQNEKPLDWKCKSCGCYMITTINNYETWEANVNY